MSCPLKNSNRRVLQRSAYDTRMNEFYSHKNKNNTPQNSNFDYIAPPFPTSRTDFDSNLQQSWCPSCASLAPTPIPFDTPYKYPNPNWCAYTNTCAPGASGSSGSAEMYQRNNNIRAFYEKNGNRSIQQKVCR